MKRNRLFVGSAFLAMAFGLNACYNEPDFGLKPNLIFKDLEQRGYRTATNINVDSLVLVVRFQDGDGDLGLSETDTTGEFSFKSPYFYNIFVNFYKKEKGVFVPVMLNNTQVNFNGRFPLVSLDGRIEPLEGDIRYTIPIFDRPDIREFPLKKGDTLRLDAKIVDRALNESNTVTSSEIILFSKQ